MKRLDHASIPEEGFSLVEMLVVLTILGLIAAITGPALQRGRQMSIADFRTRIMHDAALARIKAVSRQHMVRMDIDLAGREIARSECCERLPFPDGISMTVLTGRELVTADRSAAFLFYPDGSASGGRITVKDATDRQLSFTLNWIDGTVSQVGDD
ncbi:prepilin-type N-terminal cleavage/methylation domain-containing protein [Rhizobium sp. SG741]|uniref:prepilin-type N-terminal cleavage/methylation domain-containing protein n=1 Tax=Rhizobium sp. SG741 TaxID=2587114 RepID=UPI0014471261|nr:prepilin-type N-terminal cleavage/methylation domain-containing protein [Rhizobium sp. SG741]NKJ09004.1 general secretion pathway protein H [Rhizobium sp. SG741]